MRHSSAGSGSWEDFLLSATNEHIPRSAACNLKNPIIGTIVRFRRFRAPGTLPDGEPVGVAATSRPSLASRLCAWQNTFRHCHLQGHGQKPRETKLGRRNPLPTPISHVLSSGTLRSVNGTWRGIFDRLEAQKPGLMPAHCPSNSTVPNPGRY